MMKTKPSINSVTESESLKQSVQAKPNRQVQLCKLLRRKSGATIEQLEKAFGWQAHTARAAISRLRKSGMSVEKNKGMDGTIYRIVASGSDQ